MTKVNPQKQNASLLVVYGMLPTLIIFSAIPELGWIMYMIQMYYMLECIPDRVEDETTHTRRRYGTEEY